MISGTARGSWGQALDPALGQVPVPMTRTAQGEWCTLSLRNIIIFRYNAERSRLLWEAGQVPVPMTRANMTAAYNFF